MFRPPWAFSIAVSYQMTVSRSSTQFFPIVEKAKVLCRNQWLSSHVSKDAVVIGQYFQFSYFNTSSEQIMLAVHTKFLSVEKQELLLSPSITRTVSLPTEMLCTAVSFWVLKLSSSSNTYILGRRLHQILFTSKELQSLNG